MHETARLLRDLVSLPSVNPMGRLADAELSYEQRVTAYLENYFQNLGVPYERQTAAPQRDNIVAKFEQPGARRTLLLEVHQDTVPVDNMTIDPFGAVIENGKLYGRGACDVKGGMATMLFAFARLVREKPENAMNVTLACTVDEEHTFIGVSKLIELGIKADMAIIAEPTQLKIVNAHKGIVRWHMRTVGRACHSSKPDQGENAIYRMGRLLVGLDRFAEHLQTTKEDTMLGRPTFSVGRIEGGVSVNTVPDACRIEIDRRLLPGEDPQQAIADVTNFLQNEGGIDFPFENVPAWMALPALSPERSGDLVDELGSVIDEVKGSFEVEAVPYGTDAANISASGIPSVVFGPGNIAQAHTKDEWIELIQLEEASEILFRLAARG